eukprot:TRINITY_DN7053_c0_g1_i1.p1 TRINITY_DN7053_c0_g1~~TRINITY_DN7053_c0_g1_i1.p1  ORF type:complete len:598 (+),score=92.21 TRINITY_DN7053_c0_g1_i1:32-1795(+)
MKDGISAVEADEEAVMLNEEAVEAVTWGDAESGADSHVVVERHSQLQRPRIAILGGLVVIALLAGGTWKLLSPQRFSSFAPATLLRMWGYQNQLDPFNDPFDTNNPYKHPPVEDDSSLLVLHRGYDCWAPCLGAGICSKFCGRGNACCRKGATNDPPECAKVTDFWTNHHECVHPVEKVVDTHYAQDCWDRCHIGGDCSWCGGGNACCRFNSTLDPPECHGIVIWPTESHHTCVKPVKEVAVKHEGQDCYTFCQGGGHCNWCGYGKACCKYGDLYTPPECRAVVHFSSKEHYVCVNPFIKDSRLEEVEKMGLPAHSSESAASADCPVGKVMGKFGCMVPPEPADYEFYVYRAIGPNEPDRDFISNSNAASIGGVLLYLHGHVMGCPRKHGIDRIRRFKVSAKNPPSLARQTKGTQMGTYLEFRNGRCIWEEQCRSEFQHYGYAVGCHLVDFEGYFSGTGAYYSFPGDCPNASYGEKTKTCSADFPGGFCSKPTGEANCTYTMTKAGEVTIDELEGRNSSQSLSDWCDAGNTEYDEATDAGVGMHFWDGIHDKVKGQERMYKLGYLFWTKFPQFPKRLPEPCSFVASA